MIVDTERKGQICSHILEVGYAGLSYGLDVDVTEKLEDKSQVSCTKDPVWDGTTC